MTSAESIFARYFKFLELKGKTFNVVLGIVWMAIFGAFDILSPPQASFSFLYLFPICFVTWFGGKRAGLLIAISCAGLRSHDYVIDSPLIYAWNVLSTFSVFCTVSIMLSKIRSMLKTESELSRKDHLTGVMNSRAFSELVEYEILRLSREGSPFSIAYLDLDNFKQINDLYGHQKGDEVLISMVTNLQANLRKTDVVARLGGDEFAIFLPATDSNSIKLVIDKVREGMAELSSTNKWATTFSIGVLTCLDGECDFDTVLSTSDKLMYEVKKSGRDNVRYGVYPCRS